ncbi:MAG TPA: PEGA domain-containing protein [Gemmatimonadales bacterium]|jgi:hypothetical protein
MTRSTIAVSLIATLAFALGVAACASIMSGTGQKLNIASEPAGAVVLVDGAAVGSTPVVSKMSRNEQHTITVRLDGYQPFELKTRRRMNGWLIGNVVFGGPLGIIIDVVDGAAYKLTPKEIAAQLGRTSGAAKVENGTLYVFLTPAADSTLQKVGQLQPAH